MGKWGKQTLKKIGTVRAGNLGHAGNLNWTSLLCKVKFPPISLVFWKRKIWREKIYLAKE
jgi:hypothetical protein